MNLNKKVQTSGPASWLPQPSYAVLTPSYWLSCSPFTSCLPASGVLTEPPSHAACVNSKTHPCWAGRSQYISSSWIDAYPLNTCKKIGKCSFIKKKNPKNLHQPANQPTKTTNQKLKPQTKPERKLQLSPYFCRNHFCQHTSPVAATPAMPGPSWCCISYMWVAWCLCHIQWPMALDHCLPSVALPPCWDQLSPEAFVGIHTVRNCTVLVFSGGKPVRYNFAFDPAKPACHYANLEMASCISKILLSDLVL